MTEHLKLVLSSRLDQVRRAEDAVIAAAEKMGFVGPDQFAIRLALEEAGRNSEVSAMLKSLKTKLHLIHKTAKPLPIVRKRLHISRASSAMVLTPIFWPLQMVPLTEMFTTRMGCP